jgi:WD40 repeat protein
MKNSSFAILCMVVFLLGLAAPATCAIDPLWVEPATVGGELSGVVISADGSTILAGGDQLISLTPEGQKRWTGSSGTCLAISSDGDYILASRGQDLRLFSSTGELIWEQPMDITITDVSMVPNGSMMVATGGGRVRTVTFEGKSVASNETMAVNHVKILPPGDQILITTNKNIQISNYSLIGEWTDTNTSQNLVAVMGDGRSFVTATDNRIRMYNGSGSLIWDRKYTGGNAKALAYSRDGSTIVVGKDDSSLMVLNHYGVFLFEANASNWITSVAVSDDGNTIAAGSLDKKLYLYNHAGTALGTFTVSSPIQFNSVALTGDGSLIVVVDSASVYGLLKASFMPEEIPEETITGLPSETTMIPTTAITTRKVTTRVTTIPTPYPSPTETAEAALPPAVPLMAVGILLLCRFRNR